jgi:hypothetical protein
MKTSKYRGRKHRLASMPPPSELDVRISRIKCCVPRFMRNVAPVEMWRFNAEGGRPGPVAIFERHITN